MTPFSLSIANFLWILLFIGFSVLVVLNPSLMKGVSLEGYSNDYCQNYNTANKDSDLKDPLNLVCNNKYKKGKFIWLFIDGLAYDQLAKIPHYRQDYNFTNFFRVTASDYKQSGSLHETIISGKFSRNYPAQTTQIDHIFKQFRVANKTMNLNFVGPKFPLYDLIGEESQIVSDTVIQWSEAYAIETLCPGSMVPINDGYASDMTSEFSYDFRYLKPNVTLDYVYEKLLIKYDAAQQNIKNKFTNCMEVNHFKSKPLGSLIFFTSRIDHYNHSFDRKHMNAIYNVFSVEMSFLGVVEWINLNPEYALIISSDHGGQRYNGQDDICNHGCDEEGNEAILMVYTKELGMTYDKFNVKTKIIHHNSVAPTVAQILKNVNIPLEAQGLGYELNNDNEIRYAAVKSKEIQLIQYVKKFIMKFPNKKKQMEKFITKLTQSDFSNKITTKEALKQMDDVFYADYQQFLVKIQTEIANTISSDSNSLVYSLIFYSVIFLLLIKIYFELKHLKMKVLINKLEMIHWLILSLICLSVFLELILSFIFHKAKNTTIEQVIIMTRLIEGFILFLASIAYFRWIGFTIHQFSISLLFIVISIMGMIMIKYDMFPILRYYLTPANRRFNANIFINYPLALTYIIYYTHSLSHAYICTYPKMKLSYFLYPLSLIVLGIMAFFDKDIQESFYSHSKPRKILVRIVYGVIGFFFLLLSFVSLYTRRKESKEEDTAKQQQGLDKEIDPIQINSQHKKIKAHVLMKLAMFFYVYFISDEAERILMLLVYYPLTELFTIQFTKKNDNSSTDTSTNVYWKLICLSYILMIPDILYIITQNTFSFDISLRVTNKCIGTYADDTAIITGILMGTHKLKFFMMTAAYLLSISPISTRNYIRGDSAVIRMFLDVQMSFMICLYCFFLVSGYEKHYLQVFMWIMTKCMISVIFDIDYFLIYFFHICCKKKNKEEYQFINMNTSMNMVEMKETNTL